MSSLRFQLDEDCGEVVRRLARLTQMVSAEEMKNRLEWLNAWGAP